MIYISNIKEHLTYKLNLVLNAFRLDSDSHTSKFNIFLVLKTFCNQISARVLVLTLEWLVK